MGNEHTARSADDGLVATERATDPPPRGRSPSILYRGGDVHAEPVEGQPSVFRDLNLDQVIDAVTARRPDRDLAPLFGAPLGDVDTVQYRQAVVRDLGRPPVRDAVDAFCRALQSTHVGLRTMEDVRYVRQRQAWLVGAAGPYCDAVTTLAERLGALHLESSGLRDLHAYVSRYAASSAFATLVSETRAAEEALASIRYCIEIRGGHVRVKDYEQEPDYAAEVADTFARFRRGTVTNHRLTLPEWRDMDEVEERIAELVAQLFPDVFNLLEAYCRRHAGFVDPTIEAFDRDVQFYLAYLDHISRLQAAGLPFCQPVVERDAHSIHVREAFDLALADRLVADGAPVVRNDLSIDSPERVIVVTGANQGGKSTFARMVGQLHYLASLGLPVPAREARLALPDRVFTHFEKEEDLTTLHGKLEDELVRVHDILENATRDSVVIMNESFASTTLQDAQQLGQAVLSQIAEIGLVCVYVTFVDELATLGERTVSMVAEVAPDDPAIRTYEIRRRAPDGLAYAAAIARKFGLTYERLHERVAR